MQNKPREGETMVTEVLFGIESFKYRTKTKHLGVFGCRTEYKYYVKNNTDHLLILLSRTGERNYIMK